MNPRTLGRQRLTVSSLGLGCMGMSQAYGPTDDRESIATLQRAIDVGVTFWDTAMSYGAGHNERLLGQALVGRRDRVVLATKMGIVRDADGVHVDARPGHVREYCEASLRRLGVEHVDLYYLHRVDPDIPIEESVGAIAELVAEGKVRHLGVSECSGQQLERAAAVHPVSALLEELRRRAAEHEVTTAQLALAWLLAQGQDVVPIPGTKRPERLVENAAAAEIALFPADLDRLEAVAPPRCLGRRSSIVRGAPHDPDVGMNARQNILTERIEVAVPGGPPMGAYLARPRGDGPFPGVIVAPELFGVSAHVRDVCEHLAALGYRALAPDLHHRTAPGVELPEDAAGRARGFGLLQQMTRDQVIGDVRAALEHLRAGGSAQVGMVGLSVGSHVAYLAVTELDLAAVAVLYGWIPTTEIPLGRPKPTLTRTPAITARMLMLVGEHDHVVSPEHRQAIDQALRNAGARHETVEYPGTAHGFLSDRRETYQPQAAADAWRRIHELLDEELKELK